MVEGIVDKSGVGVAGRAVRMTSIVVVVDGIDGIGEFGLPGFRSHELNNKIGNMNENNKLVPNPGLEKQIPVISSDLNKMGIVDQYRNNFF